MSKSNAGFLLFAVSCFSVHLVIKLNFALVQFKSGNSDFALQLPNAISLRSSKLLTFYLNEAPSEKLNASTTSGIGKGFLFCDTKQHGPSFLPSLKRNLTMVLFMETHQHATIINLAI